MRIKRQLRIQRSKGVTRLLLTVTPISLDSLRRAARSQRSRRSRQHRRWRRKLRAGLRSPRRLGRQHRSPGLRSRRGPLNSTGAAGRGRQLAQRPPSRRGHLRRRLQHSTRSARSCKVEIPLQRSPGSSDLTRTIRQQRSCQSRACSESRRSLRSGAGLLRNLRHTRS